LGQQHAAVVVVLFFLALAKTSRGENQNSGSVPFFRNFTLESCFLCEYICDSHKQQKQQQQPPKPYNSYIKLSFRLELL